MIKTFLLIVLFALSFLNSSTQGNEVDKTYLYSEVDELPVFGDSNDKVLCYIYNNFNWPKNYDVQGEIIFSVIIDQEGKIKSLTVVKKLCASFEEQVKEIIQNMHDWKPGKLNGQNVNVKIYIPISFILR